MRTVLSAENGCTSRSIASTVTGISAEDTACPLSMTAKISGSGRKLHLLRGRAWKAKAGTCSLKNNPFTQGKTMRPPNTGHIFFNHRLPE